MSPVQISLAWRRTYSLHHVAIFLLRRDPDGCGESSRARPSFAAARSAVESVPSDVAVSGRMAASERGAFPGRVSVSERGAFPGCGSVSERGAFPGCGSVSERGASAPVGKPCGKTAITRRPFASARRSASRSCALVKVEMMTASLISGRGALAPNSEGALAPNRRGCSEAAPNPWLATKAMRGAESRSRFPKKCSVHGPKRSCVQFPGLPRM